MSAGSIYRVELVNNTPTPVPYATLGLTGLTKTRDVSSLFSVISGSDFANKMTIVAHAAICGAMTQLQLRFTFTEGVTLQAGYNYPFLTQADDDEITALLYGATVPNWHFPAYFEDSQGNVLSDISIIIYPNTSTGKINAAIRNDNKTDDINIAPYKSTTVGVTYVNKT